MDEIGIDLYTAVPKKLTPGAVEAADVIITMGCAATGSAHHRSSAR